MGERLKLTIDNDPFSVVIEAFQTLYPDKTCVIQFDHTLNYDEKEFGLTQFYNPELDIPLVCINPKLSVCHAVEVLAHELAHVAVGPAEEHGEQWEKAFSAIHEMFMQISRERWGEK